LNHQINANEGFGLLEGKWEGSFEDGVCPWVWTGSNKIFEHYLRNGSKPVKYGQCWVFAAVATSSNEIYDKVSSFLYNSLIFYKY
jgi:transglutaminase 1